MWVDNPRIAGEEKSAVVVMTLAWYVTRLFFSALGAVALLLTCLFSLIEFFEKLARVAHVSISQMGQFFYLNAIPSFFDVLPASAWLATIFVLRVLTTRDSWDFLQFVGFVPRRLVQILLAGSVALLLTVYCLREYYILPLAQQAEQFKYTYFKQQSQNYVMNSWFELEKNRFCFVESFDLSFGHGTGIMLITLGKDKDVLQVVRAASFEANASTAALQLKNVVIVRLVDQEVVHAAAYTIYSKFFFNVIHLKNSVYHVRGCIQYLLFASYLPQAAKVVIAKHLADHAVYYASLLWYPIITIFMFCFGLVWGGRWFWVLLPYPATVFCGMALKWAVDGSFAWLIVPGIIVFLFVIFKKYSEQ